MPSSLPADTPLQDDASITPDPSAELLDLDDPSQWVDWPDYASPADQLASDKRKRVQGRPVDPDVGEDGKLDMFDVDAVEEGVLGEWMEGGVGSVVAEETGDGKRASMASGTSGLQAMVSRQPSSTHARSHRRASRPRLSPSRSLPMQARPSRGCFAPYTKPVRRMGSS